MKRRSFIQSIGAIAALPAVPASTLAAPIATVTPPAARFWSIYMAHLHGTITPKMIATMTNVSPSIASHYLRDLVAKGVIKSSAVNFSMGAQIAAKPKPNELLDKISERLDEGIKSLTKEDTPTIEVSIESDETLETTEDDSDE